MDKLLNPDTLCILLLFGWPLVGIIGVFWYGIEKVKSDNNLKRRLVECGMSVEEIERVLKAGSKKKDDD